MSSSHSFAKCDILCGMRIGESKEEAEAALFETESSTKGKPIHVDEAKEASSFSTIKSKSIDFEALKRKYFVHEEDDDFPDFTT